MTTKDVHTEHCCIYHGCKYGEPDCPVETGRKAQSHPCEQCAHDDKGFKPMKKVYLAMRNADTTEGRGPMVIDRAFTDYDVAAEYIDDQPGVMGRKGKWSTEKYGDWQIKELPLHDSIAELRKNELVIARITALNKLTDLEKKAIKELGV